MNNVMLKVQLLKSGYNGGQVLNGITFELQLGEILGIIGRNGVGKTTLMRSLIGIIKVQQGSIVLADTNVTDLTPQQRAHLGIGYVPQGREIFGGLTVAENLQVSMQLIRKKPQFAYELQERVLNYFPSLRQRLKQKAGTMSGGEQQQLAIARALVGSPKVLLLDEPSEGVQPSIITTITDTLQRISVDLQVAIILVEQNISMIQRATQRCLVMDKGIIIKELDKIELNNNALIHRYLAI
ncbi:ABC transporter ATP-binding protein [Providencia burhodogranariea]|uniref:ABC transporter n=1 Tax=Providencia burhodogranariea DSM 19968 TaxID=1141662 RepID=K8WXA3_9GAMM|nr:ABC transporter [Providencia burhodogranariea DSM 19968]